MGVKRNVYLNMKTLTEAREILFKAFPVSDSIPSEKVSVPEAVGRVLAQALSARVSSPNFHSAAMDGIAVKAETTFGASEGRPVHLEADRDAFFVNTGNVLPADTDAVIMIEHVQQLAGGRLEIEAPAFPWQNVRKMGEDIIATELLFTRNHVVTPYCVGALLSGGIFEVGVKAKPKIMIIPTGSELVAWQDLDVNALRPGQVIETNAFVLGKLAEAEGACFEKYELVKDDLGMLTKVVGDAVKGSFDMVLILGGSSAGSEDYSKHAITALGEVLVHGVTIMPGKPLIIGKVKSKPVFGIPGYPISAIIAFERFVSPLIAKMLGRPEPKRPLIEVVPTRKIPSKLGIEEFVRVKLGQVGDRIVATPLPRAAGCITSITEADGIIRIPNNVEGLREHARVPAELLRAIDDINQNIVIVGSHDNTLDILADQIRAGHSHVSLSSSHVGSMGGLMAIKKGVCHLAGAHLLDPKDGSYNINYLKKYLAEMPVKLVHLVKREQGLIVPAGNPKGIKGIEDLARKDVTFINRQGGSGTRILLDYRLQALGIAATSINGYQNEEFTHMSVAVAVLNASADVGLGIYAAARALKLDFIPVITEHYDLVIPEVYYVSAKIQILLETINSPVFKTRVEELGGYSTEMTGKIIDV